MLVWHKATAEGQLMYLELMRGIGPSVQVGVEFR